MPLLSAAQTHALGQVRARAELGRANARTRLTALLARNVAPALDELLPRLFARSRVTLSFHPDRHGTDGLTVAEGLLRDGYYRSQFETGVTNGSPTAFEGGERDRWEELLFGGAYHLAGVGRAERPKYGALDLMQHADGGSPRFGSCFFELRREVLERTTFTWGDSHQRPEHVGAQDCFDAIALAFFDAVETTGEALGVPALDVAKAVRRLDSPLLARDLRERGRALDAYVEAQVHGDLDLSRDVEALVIDPSFDGTETGERLDELAARYGIALYRHAGFSLAPGEVPSDFRGPRMVPLAARVVAFANGRNVLDAATLGRAAASLRNDPAAWSDWGTPEETWQHLKQLWHVLVRFG